MFRFAHPDFLYLLFLLPALVAFYVYAMIVKKKANIKSPDAQIET